MKKLFSIITIILIALMSVCSVGMSAQYYVSTTGNNSADGSVGTPWQTIQKGADMATAGDTVNVADGYYNEVVIVYDATGTSIAPVTFKAASTNTIVASFRVLRPYNVIDGFTLQGYNEPSPYACVSGSDSGGRQGPQYLVIKNCVFNATNSVNKASHILLSGTDAYPTNVLITGNRFLLSYYQSIGFIGGYGHIVTNNYFNNPGGGDALVLRASNCKIVNNTVASWGSTEDLGSGHGDFVQTYSGPEGIFVTNNLFANNYIANLTNTQIGNITGPEPARWDRIADVGDVGDWTWQNNLFINCESTINIWCYGFKWYNNTFYRAAKLGAAPLSYTYNGVLCEFVAGDVHVDTNGITPFSGIDFDFATLIRFTGTDLPAPLVESSNYYATVHGGSWNVSSNRWMDRTFNIFTNSADADFPGRRIDLTTTGSGTMYVSRTHAGTRRETSGGHNAVVLNNLFVECSNPQSPVQGFYLRDIYLENFIADHNLVYGTNGYAAKSTGTFGVEIYWNEVDGINGQPPLFVDAANNDFRLLTNSPAIGAGTNLSSIFTIDFYGNTRTNWTMGAIEGTGDAPPEPPSGNKHRRNSLMRIFQGL